MIKRIQSYILSEYKDAPPSLISLVNKIMFINVVLVIGCVLYMFYTSLTLFKLTTVGGMFIAMWIMLSSLILLKKRRYKAASVLTGGDITAMMTVLIFLMPSDHILSVYRCGMLMLFALSITTFVGYTKYQVIFVGILGTVVTIYHTFGNVTQGTEQYPKAYILLSFLVIYIIIATILSKLVDDNNKLILSAEKEIYKGKERFDKLQKLVESSKDGTGVGENLINTTKNIIQLIEQTRSELEQTEEKSKNLDEKITDALMNADNLIMQTEQIHETTKKQSEGIKSSSSTITQISRTTETTANVLEEKEKAIRNLPEITKEVKKQMANLAKVVQEITNTSKDINDANSAIKNIADKTNVLAMNATIEAARAGTYGRGFMVVANEIRSLSNLTTKSTENITITLQQSIEKSKSIKVINENLHSSYDTITKGISDVVTTSSEMIDNMHEANQGTNTLIDILNKNQGMFEQVLSSITNMFSMIDNIHDSISFITDLSSSNKQYVMKVKDMLLMVVDEIKMLNDMGYMNVESLKVLEHGLEELEI